MNIAQSVTEVLKGLLILCLLGVSNLVDPPSHTPSMLILTKENFFKGVSTHRADSLLSGAVRAASQRQPLEFCPPQYPWFHLFEAVSQVFYETYSPQRSAGRANLADKWVDATVSLHRRDVRSVCRGLEDTLDKLHISTFYIKLSGVRCWVLCP